MPRAPSRSTWILAGAALLTLGGAAVAAPDPPPPKWGAWNTRAGPEPASPAPWTTDPLELESGGFAVDARAQELARAGAWAELVDLLARAADGVTAVRTPAQGPLLGPREAVRRRLLALPPAARRSFDELVEGRVKKLLATPAGPQPGREEALAELLERFGATPRAALAARLLGERLLERGDVAGAALLWRRALLEGRDPVLERRLLALRTALPRTLAGSLAAPGAVGSKPWGVLWGRPAPGGAGDGVGLRGLAADGHHVYLTDHRGLLAVERDSGRLVWRAALRGDPRSERLFVGHGRVLLVRRDRAVGVDAERGVVLWQRLLPSGGDLYALDAVATPIGFALLATIDKARHVLGVAPDGRTLFDARLWQAREVSGTRPIRARRRPPTDRPEQPDDRLRYDPAATDEDGQPLPTEFEDAAGSRVVPAYPVGLPGRPVAEDGRLAALGDRLVVDADGILASLSTVHGGVVWIRDAGGGLEVDGKKVLPAVGAGPFAVEAVTAAGHLVRLDPLDGSSLELPAPPEGTWPEPPEPPAPGAEPPATPPPEWDPPRPYVLGLSPLVLAWCPDGGRPWISVGCPPRRLLPLEPTTLGAVVGQVLALPDPEGVVLVDLATGLELGDPLPWCLRQGPLVAAGGLLFAVGAEGVVAYGPGGTLDDAPPESLGGVPLEELTRLLGDDAWRVRQAARAELAARDAEAVGDLRRAAREADTADARDAARGLLERIERKRVFARLAPRMERGLRNDLDEGRALADRLRALRDQVNPDPKGGPDPDLERMLLEQDDPDVKYALAEVLFVVDAGLRRRLLATLCDPRAEKLARVGCARALVELALRGVPSDPLRRVAQDEDLDEGTWAILTSVVQTVGGGDPQLVSDLMPRRAFAQPPNLEEFSTNAARAKLLDALPGLLDDR